MVTSIKWIHRELENLFSTCGNGSMMVMDGFTRNIVYHVEQSNMSVFRETERGRVCDGMYEALYLVTF